jgi:hypothetical protein
VRLSGDLAPAAGFDPNLPVAFLQSCPTLGSTLAGFASAKQPFVATGTRPEAEAHRIAKKQTHNA